MTPQNHVIEESHFFISGNSLWYITLSPSLVAIGSVVGENILSLSHDLASLRNLRVKWLYQQKSLKVSHYPAKFGGHRDCSSWDQITFKITWPLSQVTLWAGAAQGKSTIPPSLQTLGASVFKIMVLVCHMYLQDHEIKASYDFMGRSAAKSSSYKVWCHEHFSAGDIMFLVCYVISQSQVI